MDTKLRKLTDYKYFSSKCNKVTICRASYFYTNPDIPGHQSRIHIEGVTICDCQDTPDVEIGKKVARAKCDLQAYQEYRRRLKTAIENKIDEIQDLKNELYKMKSCIAHQKEYLSQF